MQFDLDCTVQEAQKIQDHILKSFPKKTEYMEGLKDFALRYGYIIIDEITYRRRWFPKYRRYKALQYKEDKTSEEYKEMQVVEGGIEREAMNTPTQGTGAFMIKTACIIIRKKFKEENIKGQIILLVHDEIVCEVAKEQAEQARIIVEESMKKAGAIFCPSVPFKLDVHVGEEWQH